MDNNISVKEYNKISRNTWKLGKNVALKTTTVLVIVEALGITMKGIDKHINKMPGNPSLYEIQKNCTLWNCSSF